MKTLEAALALAILSLILATVSRTPKLPKPTPNCPECRDAIMATVKETP